MAKRRFALINSTPDLSGYLTASDNATITGNWTFSGTLTIPEASVTAHQAALSITESQISDFGSYLPLAGGTLTGTLQINNAAPKYSWYESDAVADGKLWDTVAEAGVLRFRSRTDADGTGTDWMQVTRSGATVTGIEFGGNSTLGINVNTYVDLDDTSATVGIRLRTGGTQRGYLYADSNAIGILNDAGGWAIRNNHAGDTITLSGNTYIDGATGYIGARETGSYGTYTFKGETTWNGVSADDRLVFMAHATEQRGGIYDDVDNIWALQWNPDNSASSERLALYTRDNTAGIVAAYTQDPTLTGYTSAMDLRDRDGSYRDAGFNTLDIQHQNASYTLDGGDCGTVGYHNNTTAYTITLAASTDLDFPVGGMHTFINHSDTGNITIAQGTGTTLIWQHGGTGAMTGNRTLSGRAVANIWRYASTAYFIWGIGIS